MTRYLELAEYLWLAEQVTDIPADTLSKAGRIDLADSALHAPRASFDEKDFYPDIVDKAAVLCWRLARNHPLPDGNKRAAWVAMVVFIELNGGRWEPDPPNVDDAEKTMLAVRSTRDTPGRRRAQGSCCLTACARSFWSFALGRCRRGPCGGVRSLTQRSPRRPATQLR